MTAGWLMLQGVCEPFLLPHFLFWTAPESPGKFPLHWKHAVGSVNLCTAGYGCISARALLILIESLLKVQSHLLALGNFSWKKYSIFNWKTCNREFCEKAKDFSRSFRNWFKLVMHICHTDQQKAAWFESELCELCFIDLLLTVDNRQTFLFCKNSLKFLYERTSILILIRVRVSVYVIYNNILYILKMDFIQ